MARFDDDDEVTEASAALWAANVKRAIAGRRGQKALCELEQALVALGLKLLIAGELVLFDRLDGRDQYCALGAFAIWKTGRIEATGTEDAWIETVAEGLRCGLTKTLAIKISMVNDEPGKMNWATYERVPEDPEDRYWRVLAWVRRQIKEESSGSEQDPVA